MNIALPKNASQLFIMGPVGRLDCIKLLPTAEQQVKGYAIIFHPDPKGGGNNTNKVVQTIARALNQQGYICLCPNLRGVGLSDGTHDMGIGEIDDAQAIYQYVRQSSQLPIILAGFSFGASIASSLTKNNDYEHLILIAPAVTRYIVTVENISKTTVIHGTHDEIIPLTDVINWANTNDQIITVLPNTTHFFHSKLSILNNLLHRLI